MCLQEPLPPEPPPPEPPEPDPEPRQPQTGHQSEIVIEDLELEEVTHVSYPVGIGNNCFHASSKELALLIDTGAGDNICGSRFVKELERHLPPGQKIGWTRMEKPHPVSGVGNDTVHAEWRVNIPICLPGGDVTVYNAMYLDDNNTPGLLGTAAMQQAGTIIDLRGKHMHIYSGNTSGISIDTRNASNYRRYDLVQSNQGHIFMPCSNWHDAVRKNSSASSSS